MLREDAIEEALAVAMNRPLNERPTIPEFCFVAFLDALRARGFVVRSCGKASVKGDPRRLETR